MLRNMFTTVWCRFGSWSLVIKTKKISDIEQKCLVKILSSGEILKRKFGHFFAADAWLRLWSFSWLRFWSFVWSRFWILSLVEMLMLGRDYDDEIFLGTCDRTKRCFFGIKQNSTLGSVVPLAMFLSFHYCRKKKKHWGMRKIRGIDSIKKAEGRKQSVDRKDNHSTISNFDNPDLLTTVDQILSRLHNCQEARAT